MTEIILAVCAVWFTCQFIDWLGKKWIGYDDI